MAARLVYEQREEFGREHQRRGALGRERRVEHGLGVVAIARGARHEVEVLDELPAGLAREPAVVALGRFGACLHRGEADAGARLDDLLANVGALARHEMLARAIRGYASASRHRVRTFEIRVGRAQQRDALGQRDSEWIALKRGPVFAALWRDRR